MRTHKKGQGAGSDQAQAAEDSDSYPLPRIAQEMSADELVSLSQRLAPPTPPKPPAVRTLSPDLVVLVFTLILPVFLYGIYTSQRALFVPLSLGVIAAYGLYFWQRKILLARYNARMNREQAAKDEIGRALERWMRLYYCVRDDVVFDPDLNMAEDADRLAGFLRRD